MFCAERGSSYNALWGVPQPFLLSFFSFVTDLKKYYVRRTLFVFQLKVVFFVHGKNKNILISKSISKRSLKRNLVTVLIFVFIIFSTSNEKCQLSWPVVISW